MKKLYFDMSLVTYPISLFLITMFALMTAYEEQSKDLVLIIVLLTVSNIISFGIVLKTLLEQKFYAVLFKKTNTDR